MRTENRTTRQHGAGADRRLVVAGLLDTPDSWTVARSALEMADRSGCQYASATLCRRCVPNVGAQGWRSCPPEVITGDHHHKILQTGACQPRTICEGNVAVFHQPYGGGLRGYQKFAVTGYKASAAPGDPLADRLGSLILSIHSGLSDPEPDPGSGDVKTLCWPWVRTDRYARSLRRIAMTSS
jgi:hypothetical protein